MKNTTRTTSTVCFFVFALVATAIAQNGLQSGPSPAVAGPAYDVSVGYTNLMMRIPSVGHVNLNGVDVSGSVGFSSRWGATADAGYVRTPSVFDIAHQGYLLSFHSGPVFYPVEHGRTRLLVRALAGAGLVDGAVPITQYKYSHGWLARPSYVVGGGVEHFFSPQFILRVNGDYLRTCYYDPTGAVRPQNNLRVTVSAVFRLKERHHKPADRL